MAAGRTNHRQSEVSSSDSLPSLGDHKHRNTVEILFNGFNLQHHQPDPLTPTSDTSELLLLSFDGTFAATGAAAYQR